MSAVMISIRPKWVEKIANGEKTIEVRKNAPKLEVPFKCYIYCTKHHDAYDLLEWHDWGKGTIRRMNCMVVGEFVCDKIEHFDSAFSEWAYAVAPSNSIMPMHEDTAIKLCETKGAMTFDDIIAYFGDEDWKAYFWHISDLKIYDKPMDIQDFRVPCIRDCKRCKRYDDKGKYGICNQLVERPPQSWCYVEEVDE